MLWGMIIQVLALVQAMLRQMVDATYHFNYDVLGDGQWNGDVNVALTTKGNDIVASLLTIVHYGLNFVAQFTLLLPADASITYNTYLGDAGNMLHIP
jgi:hypothetical protein